LIRVVTLRKDLYSIRRFIEEDETICVINPDDGSLSNLHQLDGHPGVIFHRISGARFDDWDLQLATHFEIQGHRLINRPHILKLLRSKLDQALFFQKNNIPHPDWLAFRERYLDQDKNKKFIQKCKNGFVLKLERGNQGIGVNYYADLNQLNQMLETLWALGDQRFVISPFLKIKKECRLLVIGKNLSSCLERIPVLGGFKSNFHQEGHAKVSKPSPLMEQLSLKCHHLLGLDYASYDFVETQDGQTYLLEINPVTGFEQVEKVAKINVAKALLALAKKS